MKDLIEQTDLDSHDIPLFVDYSNHDKLQKKVHAAINKNDAIDIAVAWIHSISPNALKIIAKEVSISISEWELFHVLDNDSEFLKKQEGSFNAYRLFILSSSIGIFIGGYPFKVVNK